MVDNGGYVIVGSSTKTTNYYRVDLTYVGSNSAEQKNEDQVYNVSDFANENFSFW